MLVAGAGYMVDSSRATFRGIIGDPGDGGIIIIGTGGDIMVCDSPTTSIATG